MVSSDSLPWPREAARPAHAAAELTISPSNVALDLHGDPAEARLHIFSDGNHHMALAETVARFLRTEPMARDVFYITVPPRIAIEAIESGGIAIGNLRVAAAPHVVIGPEGPLSTLAANGCIRSHAPFMRSCGNVILRRKGNPKAVRQARDLLREDIRFAISNPVTETASFSVYESDVLKYAAPDTERRAVGDWLRSDAVVKSQLIHHREIPELVASGAADASLVYRHLGLRYARVFPDLFECGEIVDPANVTVYHAGLVDDGGPFGASFLEFLMSGEVADIYRRHGLETLG